MDADKVRETARPHTVRQGEIPTRYGGDDVSGHTPSQESNTLTSLCATGVPSLLLCLSVAGLLSPSSLLVSLRLHLLLLEYGPMVLADKE